MKRLQIFLFGVLVSIVMAPAEVRAAPLGPGDTAVPATNSGTLPAGCPGSTAKAPASANHHCPDGGLVVNGVYHPADISTSGGPVCVAVPIFAGNQGGCLKGQVEIPNDPGSGGAIIFYLKLVLRLVNGLIGAIIILVLVIAGIQYITSAGDPTNVKNAKNRVMNAVTALVLYLMMFAILNFLVPGGILK